MRHRVTGRCPMTMTVVDQQHCLYRFWDESGALLYVGITCDPGRRWPEHMRTKPWWTQIATITVETHRNRAAVLAAESTAISTEGPCYNIAPGQDLAPPVTGEEMPDCCHEQCGDGRIYLPWKWRDGRAHYRCQAGHYWTCWWGHRESGDAPENSGRPIP